MQNQQFYNNFMPFEDLPMNPCYYQSEGQLLDIELIGETEQYAQE